ncbi:hypothetical protein GCM10027347_57100 [Larkinella harenae]
MAKQFSARDILYIEKGNGDMRRAIGRLWSVDYNDDEYAQIMKEIELAQKRLSDFLATLVQKH